MLFHWCCLRILFTFILAVFVAVFLFTYLLFYYAGICWYIMQCYNLEASLLFLWLLLIILMLNDVKAKLQYLDLSIVVKIYL